MEKEISKRHIKDMGHTETAVEHSLPDYQGDIKKILSQRARLLPVGKYIGGGALEVAGAVEYSILYADAENKLTSAVFSSDYGFSMPIDEERLLSAAPDVRITGFNIRLNGPRRISAKCSLACRASLAELEEYRVEGDLFEKESEAERLERNIAVSQVFHSQRVAREYADEMGRVNANGADNVNVIVSGGTVRVEEARATEGGVLVSGTVELTAIVSTGDDSPFAISKTIPFEEVISLEGASVDMSAMADAVLDTVTTTVNDEGEGVVSIGVSATVDYGATVEGNELATVVADAYHRDYESQNGYGEYKYDEHIASGVVPLSLSVSAPRDGLISDGVRDIISASHTIKLSGVSASDLGLNIAAEISVSGVSCQENESRATDYSNFKFTSSVEENVNINCHIPEGAKIDCALVPQGISIAFDSSRISAKCEALLSYTVLMPRTERILSTAMVSSERLARGGSGNVTVYFPDSSDTLWDVARRYRTTVRDIAVANSLTESVMADFDKPSGLCGVKKLLIK